LWHAPSGKEEEEGEFRPIKDQYKRLLGYLTTAQADEWMADLETEAAKLAMAQDEASNDSGDESFPRKAGVVETSTNTSGTTDVEMLDANPSVVEEAKKEGD
jgi:hypothetical protein